MVSNSYSVANLTLTRVVFEYFLMERLEGFRQDLTLTRVVFELWLYN